MHEQVRASRAAQCAGGDCLQAHALGHVTKAIHCKACNVLRRHRSAIALSSVRSDPEGSHSDLNTTLAMPVTSVLAVLIAGRYSDAQVTRV